MDSRRSRSWFQVSSIASSVDTEDPDIYLDKPSWVDTATRARITMTGVDGVLISRDQIRFIQVYRP